MPKIERLEAMEILDSRGRPTVAVRCTLNGVSAAVGVPSGASTGTAEALELRDGDRSRYRGLGCRKAVANVEGEIARRLVGATLESQRELDDALIKLDGTPNKSRLGANAILGVSIAFASACAALSKRSLAEHFAAMAGRTLAKPPVMPRLTVNLFSGGKHAGGQVPIQDVLLVPVSAKSVDQGLANVFAVYYAAADLTTKKYMTRLLRADEGGQAPPFTSVEAMLDDAVEAIRAAGLTPGKEMAIALDVASSHFYRDGKYELGHTPARPIDSRGMIDVISGWVDAYPIVSVEDGLAEEDWTHWPALRARLKGRAITLGDDFLCTNPARIRRAIDAGACDALLLKVNQIGTLTEAGDALKLARSANWHVTVSARSGETEDSWLADLAVGWGGDDIKIGSITQSERLAKYNRLLAMEKEGLMLEA